MYQIQTREYNEWRKQALKLAKSKWNVLSEDDIEDVFIDTLMEVITTKEDILTEATDKKRAAYFYVAFNSRLLNLIKKKKTLATNNSLLLINNRQESNMLYDNEYSILETLTDTLVEDMRRTPSTKWNALDRSFTICFVLGHNYYTISLNHNISTHTVTSCVKRFLRVIILKYTNYDTMQQKILKPIAHKMGLLIASYEAGYPISSVQFMKEYRKLTNDIDSKWTNNRRVVSVLIENVSKFLYQEEVIEIKEAIIILPTPIQLEDSSDSDKAEADTFLLAKTNMRKRKPKTTKKDEKVSITE